MSKHKETAGMELNKEVSNILDYMNQGREEVTEPAVISWLEDVELIKIACCTTLTITSKTKTRLYYPFILGNYSLVPLDRKTVYKKIGEKPQYLSRPVAGYSWGVSSMPGARWGYVRSSKAAPCPHMAGHWLVYHRGIKRWVRDWSFTVQCYQAS